MNINPRWPNFSIEEFACNCGCGTNEIDHVLIDRLQAIRTLIGRPFVITSGYRCSDHPIEVAKARSGVHEYGKAADIACDMYLARAILRQATHNPVWTGIGIQQKGDKCFVHLDIASAMPSRPRPALWTY